MKLEAREMKMLRIVRSVPAIGMVQSGTVPVLIVERTPGEATMLGSGAEAKCAVIAHELIRWPMNLRVEGIRRSLSGAGPIMRARIYVAFQTSESGIPM